MDAQDIMKFSKTTHLGSFFYSPKKPIIGNNIPSVCTFICRNIPFVYNKRSFGFTLVELIITLAVAAILTTIALPSFRNIIDNSRQTDFINTLSADLGYTRSEAIKRSTNVGICSTINQTACSGATNWATGWIVWIDSDNSSTRNGAEQILKTGNQVEGVGLAITSSVNSLIYARNGFLNPDTTTASFKFCDQRGTNYAAAIAVSGVGRPSIDRPLQGGMTCP
ncbi:MAG: hypothetical protein BMS9Abin11_1203 [Gammaproteobacteria bacterium]|nr:MAG: hypothetical protein BMS9Abin11_1203 [Gammaproteobacteria bacterium]